MEDDNVSPPEEVELPEEPVEEVEHEEQAHADWPTEVSDNSRSSFDPLPVEDVAEPQVAGWQPPELNRVEMSAPEVDPVRDVEMSAPELGNPGEVPGVSKLDVGVESQVNFEPLGTPGYHERATVERFEAPREAPPPDFTGVPQGPPLSDEEPKFFRPHSVNPSTVEAVNFEDVQRVSEQENVVNTPDLAPPVEEAGIEVPEFEEPPSDTQESAKAIPQDRVIQNAARRREERHSRMGFQGVIEEDDFGRMDQPQKDPGGQGGGEGELAQILTVLQEISSKLDALVNVTEEQTQELSDISSKIENVGGLA